jgi:hypothetical protein
MLILDTSDLQFPRHDSASLNLPKRIAGFIGALSAPLNAPLPLSCGVQKYKGLAASLYLNHRMMDRRIVYSARDAHVGHARHDMPFTAMSPWPWTIRSYRNDYPGLIYSSVTRDHRTISAQPDEMSPAGINFALSAIPRGEF